MVSGGAEQKKRRLLELLQEAELLLREAAAGATGSVKAETLSFADAVADERLRPAARNLQRRLFEFAPPGSRKPEGFRHFGRALRSAREDGFIGDAFAEGLLALADELRWSAFYNRDPWSRSFVDDIAAIRLAAPSGPLISRHLIVGCFLMGPEVTYPFHAHDAEELYLVLGGSISFQWEDDGPWHPKAPGEPVHHPSRQPHAMLSGDRAAFALYLWRGEIHSPSWHKERMAAIDEPRKYADM